MSKQAMAYKDKGNEEFKKGNHGKAIEFYTYATEMDPTNHTFFTNRSNAYFKMKNYEKSLRDAQKSVKLNAKWEKGYFRAGEALMALDRAQEALAMYKEACDMCPDNATFADAHVKAKQAMMKGMSAGEIMKTEANELFKKGDQDKAIIAYGKALRACKPEEKELKADILANRAACNRQLYKPDEVIADCTAALELVPTHCKALVRRAQAYESMEKYKKSLADFEMACRISPSMQVAYQGTSRIRQAMKKLGML